MQLGLTFELKGKTKILACNQGLGLLGLGKGSQTMAKNFGLKTKTRA